MTTKVKGTEGIEFPDATVQATSAVLAGGAGYTDLPDGTRIQRGVASTLSTTQNTITYPVAFVGTPPVVVATCGDATVAFNFAIISAIGLTTFGLGSIQHDGVRVSVAGVQWIAIGRWKA